MRNIVLAICVAAIIALAAPSLAEVIGAVTDSKLPQNKPEQLNQARMERRKQQDQTLQQRIAEHKLQRKQRLDDIRKKRQEIRQKRISYLRSLDEAVA